MTPSLGMEPGSHWWEASAFTTAPSLHPENGYFIVLVTLTDICDEDTHKNFSTRYSNTKPHSLVPVNNTDPSSPNFIFEQASTSQACNISLILRLRDGFNLDELRKRFAFAESFVYVVIVKCCYCSRHCHRWQGHFIAQVLQLFSFFCILLFLDLSLHYYEHST